MQAHEQVVVIGASGFGRESLDVLEAMQNEGSSINVLGVVDDSPSEENLARLRQRGVAYLGTIGEWLAEGQRGLHYVLGIGNPLVRSQLAIQLDSEGLLPFSAVHPAAMVGSRSDFGPGVVICAGVVISTNVWLGKHVHLNPNATIGHDAEIADFVSINPGAVISGEVKIRRQVLIGAAALVLQQLTVGEKTVVGAASLVTKNVPAGKVVKGVPGKWIE